MFEEGETAHDRRARWGSRNPNGAAAWSPTVASGIRTKQRKSDPFSTARRETDVVRWPRKHTEKRDPRDLKSIIDKRRSIRFLLSHYGRECPQQDLDIEPQAPIVYIPQVQIDTFLHQIDRGRFTSKSIDLCPTGNSGF